jgi:type I restriction enzyme S subunit
LAGRVGQDTVGKVYLPYPLLLNSIASDNIIRIRLENKNDINFLFGFLSSKIGKEMIRKRKTGVGQPFITEEMLKNIPVPILSDLDLQFVNQNIEKYRKKINKSLECELQAINLIEKEIDSWQVA